MATSGLNFASILENATSEAAAFAAGLAIGPTLAPLLRALENDTWALAPEKPLDPATAAEVAAELYAAYDAMSTEASYSGIDAARFAYLWDVTLTGPGMGELLTMLRRTTISADDFTHGLRKSKFEDRWDAALTDLQHVRLTPQEIALGIVRSVVADPGLLAATLDLSGGVVPAYPEWAGDALAEAAAGGIDKDRLRVMVGEIGLPMSAQQAASAYFRKIIELGDFNRAILEGDTRPEWAPFILDQAREILTASQYQEAALRGVLTPAQADAKTAQHGMSAEDTATLFAILGRPLAVHQITTGLARGGTFGGTYDDVPEPYRDAIRRSNVRPEYAVLDWYNRYSYPSGFQIKSEAPDLGAELTNELLLEIGWNPKWATFFSGKWSAGATTAAAADPNVKKAHTKAWTEAQSSYIAQEATAADVQPIFSLLGVAPAAQTEIISTWDAIRALVRKQLTPAEIRKALGDGLTNPATGVAWTTPDATAALLARGYDAADAQVFLEE